VADATTELHDERAEVGTDVTDALGWLPPVATVVVFPLGRIPTTLTATLEEPLAV
jgi:hypothetical protein